MDTAIAEQPTVYAEFRGKICKANASQLGKLGAIKRMESLRARKEAEKNAEQSKASVKAENKALACDPTFAEQVKARARKAIMATLDKLEQEDEPAAIDRLASGFSRLCEVERQLDGRPLPGSLRPSSKPAKAPSNHEPEPI